MPIFFLEMGKLRKKNSHSKMGKLSQKGPKAGTPQVPPAPILGCCQARDYGYSPFTPDVTFSISYNALQDYV